MAGFVQKSDHVREQLRESLPTAQRLGSLQQGIERRTEKLQTMATRLAELRSARMAMYAQRQEALRLLNTEYDQKEADMDRQIKEMCQQHTHEELLSISAGCRLPGFSRFGMKRSHSAQTYSCMPSCSHARHQ
eukprot:644455-Amphidinium_carterae.1